MTSTRVPGHGLRNEGRVFEHGHRINKGSGRCECGETSPVFLTDAARKRWHREHKNDVLRGKR